MQKTLKQYFEDKGIKNHELIGLKVETNEGNEYYINDIDAMFDSDLLPNKIFVGSKQGSNYGRYIDSDRLFVNK